MMNFRLLIICTIIALIYVSNASGQKISTTNASASWIGKYKYTYSESETQGGVVPIVEYLIDVSRQGESLVARFTSDGYQSYEDFSCTAEVNGNRLNLHFLKDLRDADRYAGVNKMKLGQIVGALDKVTVRGRVLYSYRDGVVILRGISKTPTYFKKSR